MHLGLRDGARYDGSRHLGGPRGARSPSTSVRGWEALLGARKGAPRARSQADDRSIPWPEVARARSATVRRVGACWRGSAVTSIVAARPTRSLSVRYRESRGVANKPLPHLLEGSVVAKAFTSRGASSSAHAAASPCRCSSCQRRTCAPRIARFRALASFVVAGTAPAGRGAIRGQTCLPQRKDLTCLI
jgi:hypothetical protein